MHSYAQTNVQLFNQLLGAGYSKEDLICVHKSYELAMRLCASRYQPDGKPFASHLVGLASILASLKAPAEVVAAAVLHSLYLYGDFGNGPINLKISNADRKAVRVAVGERVEEYVYRYIDMKWDSKTIPVLRDTLDTLNQIDRYAVMMHIANDLEHHLDLGVLYYSRPENYRRFIGKYGAVIIEIAERLGYLSLAAELEQVFKETDSAEIPVELRTTNELERSFLIAPKSYKRKLPLVIKDGLIHRLRRLRSIFG